MATKVVPIRDPERAALERRRVQAERLLAQSQQGVPQEWSRMRVTPSYGIGQGLTQLGQALLGRSVEKGVTEDTAALDEKQRKAYGDQLRGIVSQPIQPGQPGSGVLQPGQPAPLNPQQESAISSIGSLPLEQQGQLVAQAGLSKLMPQKPVEVGAGGALVNPTTGEETYRNPATRPPPPDNAVEQIVGPDGKPVYVSRADSIGKEPYHAPTASGVAAAGLTEDAKELAWQTFKTTGQTPPIGRGGAATQVAFANYFAKRAKDEGNTGAELAAKRQSYQASQKVVDEFTSSKPGSPGGSITAINTAVAHMDALRPLIEALGNGDTKVLNELSNSFKQQTGNPAPTNFAAIKEFVAGEVAKAVLPGGGGEQERRALAAPLDAANSPQALHQAVIEIQKALAGKTEALRNQWDIGTSGTQGEFDKFLVPATRKALGFDKPAAPPTTDPAPQGVDPETWKFLTPQERALWQ